jgi:hypothetical protein
MRKVSIVFMLLAFAVSVSAQEQNPAKDDMKNASFFGPVVRFTSIRKQAGVMAGLRGSWPVGRSLALGGAAYFLISKVNAPEDALPLEGPLDVDLTYLGFELEYFLNPGSQTRFSLSALFGGGASRYVKDTGSFFRSNEQSGETAFMFIVEPGGNVEWTVAKWLRLMAGVSYRLVSGTRQEKLTDRDLRGPSATIAFKF